MWHLPRRYRTTSWSHRDVLVERGCSEHVHVQGVEYALDESLEQLQCCTREIATLKESRRAAHSTITKKAAAHHESQRLGGVDAQRCQTLMMSPRAPVVLVAPPVSVLFCYRCGCVDLVYCNVLFSLLLTFFDPVLRLQDAQASLHRVDVPSGLRPGRAQVLSVSPVLYIYVYISIYRYDICIYVNI